MTGKWKKVEPSDRLAVLQHCMAMHGLIGSSHKIDALPLVAEDSLLIAKRLDELEHQVEQLEREKISEFFRGNRDTPA